MRTLMSLNDFPLNARICLYGAGHYGESLLSLLRQQRKDVVVSEFVDTFKTGTLSGLDIKGPDSLADISTRVDLIVIASDAFQSQMGKTLQSYGVTNYALLNPMFHSSTMDQGEESSKSARCDILYAFYDLSVSYPGYDIVNFLFVAETERILRGCEFLHPVFVPRPGDTLVGRRSADCRIPGFDQDYADWMMRQVMVPCCWLVPSCRQVTVCHSRQEAALIQQQLALQVFPGNYQVTHPVEGCTWPRVFAAAGQLENPPTLKASEMALGFVKSWIEANCRGRKVVTVSLRESDSAPERNSNVASWLRFAETLNKEEFHPVFLRDTGKSLNETSENFQGFSAFSAAVWNVELRMALYQLSYINMFVSNGPAAMCMFNRQTRALQFCLVGESRVISKEHYESIGVPVGSQYAHVTPFQKNIWGNDDYQALVREFTLLHSEIQAEA